MAGKHRAGSTPRRRSEAHALLGTGAITLGLGIALTTGAGVAAADSSNNSSSSGNQAPTTTIRTTISAQSVNTSTYAPAPGAENGTSQEQGTSVVTTKDSVVRQQNPAVTGDNNPGPGPTLAETLVGGGQSDQGLGIPGLDTGPQIPFFPLGGGGGGLLAKLLGGGLF